MKACLAVPTTRAGVAAAFACLALAAACREPTRLPTVFPTTPTETIFSLAGTVTETAPTTSTRIPNALVTLDGTNSGQSTTADGDGRFLFPELKSGQFNLVASRDGYLTNSFVIYLTRDSDFAIRLDPVPDMTTATFRGTLASTGSGCWDTLSPPCHSHSFTHRSGMVTARLTWTGDAELSMLMTDGWDTRARGTHEFSVSAGPGQYEVWVVYSSGSVPAPYTLVITHQR